MEPTPMVKIEVFIPEQYVPPLRDSLHAVGAGRIGRYDHCVSILQVRGYWRPLDGAMPFQGTPGAISEGQECKVEVRCPWGQVQAAVRAIRRIHPYEDPVINVVPLLNHLLDMEAD